MTTREDALQALVALSEDLGLYDRTVEDYTCHCGRVCCRHHEAGE